MTNLFPKLQWKAQKVSCRVMSDNEETAASIQGDEVT